MKGIQIRDLNKKSDERGWLIEVLGEELLGECRQFGQIHVSVAHPGKVRGNHYHKRKTEWFSVPSGTGLLRLRDIATGEETEIIMGENALKTVKITPGIVHAIKNNGPNEMVLIVYTSESFDPADPDTYYQNILN
ncbi:MAG: WxcM-like domain-containing protein [Nitrospinaceae bacterium]